MPDIVNPQVIKFANEQARQAADQLAQTFYRLEVVLDQWTALNGASLPNDGSVVVDGAQTDGRPILTGAKLHNLMSRLSESITDYEANSNAKLNTVLGVAVNPQK